MGNVFKDVANWLPELGEKLTHSLITKKLTAPDGTSITVPNSLVPDNIDLSRLLPKSDISAPLSVLKKTIMNPDGTVNEVRKGLVRRALEQAHPKAVYPNGIDYDLNQFFTNLASDKITNFDQVPTSAAALLMSEQNRRLLANPGDTSGLGMSVSKFLGHATQAGAVGGALLAAPYALKRRQQHKQLAKELEEEELSSIKSASGEPAVKSERTWTFSDLPFWNNSDDLSKGISGLSEIFKQETPASYYGQGKQAPSMLPWKSYSPFVLPAAVAALMIAGKFANTGVIKAIDKTSDKIMDKHERDQRKRIARLMSASKVTKEAGVKSAKFANPVEGSLYALWLALAPAFYQLGHKVGGNTSDADKYSKLEKAFDKMKREQPRSLVYNIGDELGVEPGNYLGQTRVTIPVKRKEDENRKQPTTLFA